MNRFFSLRAAFSLRATGACVVGLLLSAGLSVSSQAYAFGDPHKVKLATEAAEALDAAQQTAVSAVDARSVRIDPAALAEAARLRVDRYVTAERLTQELAVALHLQANPEAIERLHLGVAHLLGADTPAGFAPATADIITLEELIGRHSRAMQRWLAPWLPQPAYDRYVALLDDWKVQ